VNESKKRSGAAAPTEDAAPLIVRKERSSSLFRWRALGGGVLLVLQSTLAGRAHSMIANGWLQVGITPVRLRRASNTILHDFGRLALALLENAGEWRAERYVPSSWTRGWDRRAFFQGSRPSSANQAGDDGARQGANDPVLADCSSVSPAKGGSNPI